jgi:MarR family transcriptional regulator for hemolysin
MAKQSPSRRSAPGDEILEQLGLLIQHMTRLTGSVNQLPSLTVTQRLALFVVAEDSPLRLADLAARLGVTPPTASRAVDVLVELGLVTRVPDPSDRRALRLEPTPEGRRQFDARRARAAAAFAPAARSLDDGEREQLANLLGRLREALEQSNG